MNSQRMNKRKASPDNDLKVEAPKKKLLPNYRSHECHDCHELLTSAEEETLHKQKHEEERLAIKQATDDFVKLFVLPNHLDDYNGEFQISFDHLFSTYRENITLEHLEFFITKLDLDIMKYSYAFGSDNIISLFERNVITEKKLTDVISDNPLETYDLIEYLLEHNYSIEADWVGILIRYGVDDELIESIKEKHNFTFDEIFGAVRCWDDRSEREFHKAVHKFFPDSDFEESEPESHTYWQSYPDSDSDSEVGPDVSEFVNVATYITNDYLHHKYHYDESEDQLWIMVRTGAKFNIGKLCELNKLGLHTLLKKYKTAIDVYKFANERVQKLFNRLEFGHYFDRDYLNEGLYDHAIPFRNDCANMVSKIYFVIAEKAKCISLECIAIKNILDNNLDYFSLPKLLKEKICQFK